MKTMNQITIEREWKSKNWNGCLWATCPRYAYHREPTEDGYVLVCDFHHRLLVKSGKAYDRREKIRHREFEKRMTLRKELGNKVR